MGTQTHCQVVKHGFENDAYVQNSDVDNSPESLLVFSGNKEVHGLYDLLLNYRSFLTLLSGSDVPVLCSPVPFQNAAMSSPDIKCMEMRRVEHITALLMDLLGKTMILSKVHQMVSFAVLKLRIHFFHHGSEGRSFEARCMELDTRVGAPSHLNAIIRHFYPNLSATLSVGVQYDKHETLRYSVCGKKTFPVTTDGLVTFNIKGRCDVDKEFKERKNRGAAEFSWSIFNFQKEQDVRFRVGYEVFEQIILGSLYADQGE